MKKGTLDHFTNLEDIVQKQLLDAEQVFFRQLMDVYYNIGTPSFEEKLKAFQYSVEAHHRVQADEEYKKELGEAIVKKEDEIEKIKSIREPGYNKEIPMIEEYDAMLVFKAVMRTLGRNGLLYRKEHFQRI
jgi:hypothetical protein